MRHAANPTPWGISAANLIRLAGVDQGVVAQKAGISKQHLSNCFSGRRVPGETLLRAINRAAAEAAGLPAIAPFLDDEAILCGLLDGTRMKVDRDTLIGGMIGLLRTYDAGRVFRAGYRERIAAFMQRCDEAAALRFAVEVNRAFQRVLLAQLTPPAEHPHGFSEVCLVLGRYGFDARLLSSNGARLVAHERLQWAIARELVAANPVGTYRERHAALSRIFRVLETHYELRLRKGKS